MIRNISDKIVFNSLRPIKHGSLKVTNYDGNVYFFGEKNKKLNVELVINKPGLTYDVIKNGSIGFAEAYMRGDFKTNNLSDLIELTAKNINTVHKFSGFLDLSLINYFKNFFIGNTKKKVKKIFRNIMI